MSSTLFCLLDRVMLSGESLQLNVSRGANDILVVLMQPVLRPTTETLSDDVEAIRAALAAPLYLAMPAAQLDARFEDLAGTYAAARTETHTGFDSLMQALREATKSAKVQTSNAQRRSGSAAAPATRTVSAKPAPPEPAADTDADETEETLREATPAPPPPPPPARTAAPSKEPDLFSTLEGR